MGPLRKLPGFRPSPPGLEWKVPRCLPSLAFAGALAPILGVIALNCLARDGDTVDRAKVRELVDVYAAGAVVTHVPLVPLVAIACIIVVLMKGPAHVADAYEVPASDRPR